MPLIVTATLDGPAQERFDALRRRHFPPERNHLAAHLTLFHALPDDPTVAESLAEAARRPPIPVRVTGIRLLGRGVAYRLEAPELLALRAEIGRGRDLTAQDRGKRELHVTVQNKVTPEEARALHEQLCATFAPETVTATGLALWRYLGGPWEPLAEFGFGAPQGLTP
jgi:2'-5' RNA ligase